MQLNTTSEVDQMYPHSGSFSLSGQNDAYPTFNQNIYLLMRGFNAIKVHGDVSNAEILLVWNLDRDYGTSLYGGADNEIEDVLVFPFMNNDGTITFKGKPIDPSKDWKATLDFEFVSLTQDQIEELRNSDSS